MKDNAPLVSFVVEMDFRVSLESTSARLRSGPCQWELSKIKGPVQDNHKNRPQFIETAMNRMRRTHLCFFLTIISCFFVRGLRGVEAEQLGQQKP